ncbi:DYL1 protein, partial [Pandion haliaetus]|nr:DYL1 protein [Pandion haliaetus]
QAIMSDRKAVIKNADMSEEMQQDAVECATQSLEEHNVEHDTAAHIKRISEFDRKYNPTWQCTVGRNFVTQKTGHFILVFLGPVTVLDKG